MNSAEKAKNWIKKTPSPQSIRNRILTDCISKIRSKRSNIINEYRREDSSSRERILSDIMQDINIVGLVGKDDSELMFEIEEAIRKELDSNFDLEYDGSIEYFDAFVGSEDCSFEYLDDSFIICPVCKSKPLDVSLSESVVQCQCGMKLALRNIETENPAEQLRQRLAAVYDRHFFHCTSSTASDQGTNTNTAMETCDDMTVAEQKATTTTLGTLNFQMFGDALHAWCSSCGYHEDVT